MSGFFRISAEGVFVPQQQDQLRSVESASSNGHVWEIIKDEQSPVTALANLTLSRQQASSSELLYKPFTAEKLTPSEREEDIFGCWDFVDVPSAVVGQQPIQVGDGNLSSLTKEATRISDTVLPIIPTEDDNDYDHVDAMETRTTTIYQKIAQGKAKIVLLNSNFPDKVYYIAVAELTGGKQKEIQQEVKTADTIKAKLSIQGTNPTNSNLHLDLQTLTSIEGEIVDTKVPRDVPKKFKKNFAVETLKADGDLENRIRSSPCSLQDGLKIACQFTNGMKNLHNAGFVHGDMKPENVLVFGQGPNPMVKISDFGKTEAVAVGKTAIYSGNPRFAPPERNLSQKGEVYSSALVIIRTLEEGLLQSSGQTTLVPPEKVKVQSKDNRRGIEKFLIEDERCKQREHSLWGRVTALCASTFSSNENPLAQAAVHSYIDSLTEAFTLPELAPEKVQGLKDLNALLKHMTASNPEERITMVKAHDAMERIAAILARD